MEMGRGDISDPNHPNYIRVEDCPDEGGVQRVPVSVHAPSMVPRGQVDPLGSRMSLMSGSIPDIGNVNITNWRSNLRGGLPSLESTPRSHLAGSDMGSVLQLLEQQRQENDQMRQMLEQQLNESKALNDELRSRLINTSTSSNIAGSVSVGTDKLMYSIANSINPPIYTTSNVLPTGAHPMMMNYPPPGIPIPNTSGICHSVPYSMPPMSSIGYQGYQIGQNSVPITFAQTLGMPSLISGMAELNIHRPPPSLKHPPQNQNMMPPGTGLLFNLNSNALICANMPKFTSENEHNPVQFLNDFEAYMSARGVPQQVWSDLLISSVGVVCEEWVARSRTNYSYDTLKVSFLSVFWSRAKQASIFEKFESLKMEFWPEETFVERLNSWVNVLERMDERRTPTWVIASKIYNKLHFIWRAKVSIQAINDLELLRSNITALAENEKIFGENSACFRRKVEKPKPAIYQTPNKQYQGQGNMYRNDNFRRSLPNNEGAAAAVRYVEGTGGGGVCGFSDEILIQPPPGYSGLEDNVVPSDQFLNLDKTSDVVGMRGLKCYLHTVGMLGNCSTDNNDMEYTHEGFGSSLISYPNTGFMRKAQQVYSQVVSDREKIQGNLKVNKIVSKTESNTSINEIQFYSTNVEKRFSQIISGTRLSFIKNDMYLAYRERVYCVLNKAGISINEIKLMTSLIECLDRRHRVSIELYKPNCLRDLFNYIGGLFLADMEEGLKINRHEVDITPCKILVPSLRRSYIDKYEIRVHENACVNVIFNGWQLVGKILPFAMANKYISILNGVSLSENRLLSNCFSAENFLSMLNNKQDIYHKRKVILSIPLNEVIVTHLIELGVSELIYVLSPLTCLDKTGKLRADARNHLISYLKYAKKFSCIRIVNDGNTFSCGSYYFRKCIGYEIPKLIPAINTSTLHIDMSTDVPIVITNSDSLIKFERFLLHKTSYDVIDRQGTSRDVHVGRPKIRLVGVDTYLVDEEYDPTDCYCRMKIGDILCVSLVDSGAAISVINKKFLSTLNDSQVKISDIARKPSVIGVGGGEVGRIEYACDIIVCFDNSVCISLHFYVLESLKNDIIISADIMKKWRGGLLWECRSFYLINTSGHRCVSKIYEHSELIKDDYDCTINTLRVPVEVRTLGASDASDLGSISSGMQEVRNRLWKKILESVDEGKISFNEAVWSFEELLVYADVFRPELGRYNGAVPEVELYTCDRWESTSFNVPQIYLNRVREKIKRMEEDGQIIRSNSTYLSPLVVTEKSNGDIRVCIAAYGFNRLVKKQSNCAPLVFDVIIDSEGDDFVSTFDWAQGFMQIPLNSQIGQFLAFRFEGQCYQYAVWPFGTAVSLSVFVECVNFIVRKILDEKLSIFIDDARIRTKSLVENVRKCIEFLQCVLGSGMTLSLDKTQLFKAKVKHLGFIIGSGEIEKDVKSLKCFENFENRALKKKKRPLMMELSKIQALLGYTVYYSMFVPNYTRLVEPFVLLLKGKRKTIEWLEEHDVAFQELKSEFMKPFKAMKPTFDMPFNLNIRVEDEGRRVHAILTQNDRTDGSERVILFVSRNFKAAQLRYTIQEKCILGIYLVVQKIESLLYGNTIRISEEFDPMLRVGREVAMWNKRVGAWILYLNCFKLVCDLPVNEKSGIGRVHRDMVPEITVNHFSVQTYEEEMARLDEKLVYQEGNIEEVDVRYFGVKIEGVLHSAIQNLERHQEADEKICKIKLSLNEVGSRYGRDYKVVNETLYRIMSGGYEVPVLPKCLETEVVNHLHLFYGHPGSKKLASIASRFFWWLNMEKKINRIVNKCVACQVNKVSNQSVVPEFKSVRDGQGVGEFLTVDLFGPLPESRSKVTAILVCRDLATGYVWAFNLVKQKAEKCAEKLQEILQFVQAQGHKTRVVLADNGVQFRSHDWLRVCKKYGVEARFNTARNPKSNPTERVMRDLGNRMRIYINTTTHNEANGHTAWALCVQDIVNSFNDTPFIEIFSPNMLWGISSKGRPFGDLVEPNTPNISNRLAELEKELCEENKGDSEEYIRCEDGSIMVYTDGACIRNGREDATGAIGVWFGEGHKLNVSEVPKVQKVTNNVMETLAVERAVQILLALGEKSVKIVTDSKYVIGEVARCLQGVDKRKAKGKNLEFNEGILKELADLIDHNGINVQFQFTKGHGSDYGNKMADYLATRALILSQKESIGEPNTECNTIDRFLMLRSRLENLKREVRYYKENPRVTYFKEGERVFVSRYNISNKEGRVTAKLFPKFDGPFIVRCRLRFNLYLVISESDPKIERVVNVENMRRDPSYVVVRALEMEPVKSLEGKPKKKRGRKRDHPKKGPYSVCIPVHTTEIPLNERFAKAKSTKVSTWSVFSDNFSRLPDTLSRSQKIDVILTDDRLDLEVRKEIYDWLKVEDESERYNLKVERKKSKHRINLQPPPIRGGVDFDKLFHPSCSYERVNYTYKTRINYTGQGRGRWGRNTTTSLR